MPHVALADTSSAAASLLNGLNAAANQQANQQQQQLRQQQADQQRELDNSLRIAAAGGIPADTETESTTPNGSRFIARKPNPAAQGEGQRVRNAGRHYYIPTDEEKGKSFVATGQLAEALKGAGFDPNKPITPEQSHNILQSLNLAQPQDEPYDIDTSGKFQDAQGNPSAVMIGRRSGKVRMLDLSGSGASQSRTQPQPGGGSPGGPFDLSQQMDEHGKPTQPAASAPAPANQISFAPPGKADKPARTRVDLTNFNQPVSVNEDTGEINALKLPAGVNRAMSPAQTEADKDRHVRQSELEENRARRLAEAQEKQNENKEKSNAAVAAKHDDFKALEQDQWALRGTYANLADPTQNPDGSTVILPKYDARTHQMTEGGSRVMNPQLRASLTQLSEQSKRRALEHQANATKIRKSMGWGEFGQQPPAAPRTTAPATPGRGARPRAKDPAGLF